MRASSRYTSRVMGLALLALAGLSSAFAGTAAAATVSATDQLITFRAASDEANDLSLEMRGDSVYLADAGAAITAGAGCTPEGEGVSCPEPNPENPRIALSISLGDRSDRLGFDDCIGENRPVTVWASAGNDSIVIGSCVGAHLTVYGGAHEDRIATSLNHSGFSRLYGGDGRDRLAVNEGGRAFLFGGPNHDELSYNAYVYDELAPTDSVEVRGGSGNDTISPVERGGVEQTVFGEDGIDTLELPDDGSPGFFDMAACATCDLERVIGTDSDDVIYGDGDTNWIWSGEGNDTIDPRGARDYVYAGGGDDIVTATDGVLDTIRCGDGLLDEVFADRRESLGECEIVHRRSA
jgi:Ca2+-binding RTX toxin-like protein